MTLLVLIRLAGRRTLGQMTAFDFVLLLIVAETTQQALLGDDFSITNAVMVVVTLIVMDIGLSYVRRWWPTADMIIEGHPTVLVVEGRPDEPVMQEARVDLADILEAARLQHGLVRLDQVRFAILEASGHISIVPKQG